MALAFVLMFHMTPEINEVNMCDVLGYMVPIRSDFESWSGHTIHTRQNIPA